MSTLKEGHPGHVPHFEVTALDGRRVRYHDIWQRRNLVLVIVDPHDDSAAAYASRLTARQHDFDSAETTIVITDEPVPGLSAPVVVVADRWGEILHVTSPSTAHVSRLPEVDDVLCWVHFVRMQCPECPP